MTVVSNILQLGKDYDIHKYVVYHYKAKQFRLYELTSDMIHRHDDAVYSLIQDKSTAPIVLHFNAHEEDTSEDATW